MSAGCRSPCSSPPRLRSTAGTASGRRPRPPAGPSTGGPRGSLPGVRTGGTVRVVRGARAAPAGARDPRGGPAAGRDRPPRALVGPRLRHRPRRTLAEATHRPAAPRRRRHARRVRDLPGRGHLGRPRLRLGADARALPRRHRRGLRRVVVPARQHRHGRPDRGGGPRRRRAAAVAAGRPQGRPAGLPQRLPVVPAARPRRGAVGAHLRDARSGRRRGRGPRRAGRPARSWWRPTAPGPAPARGRRARPI